MPLKSLFFSIFALFTLSACALFIDSRQKAGQTPPIGKTPLKSLFFSIFTLLTLSACAPFIDSRHKAGQIAPTRKKTPLKPLFFSIFTLLTLSACAPFIDSRREAGQLNPSGTSRPDTPVICYGLFTTPDERQALADSVCQKQNKTAHLTHTTPFTCTLFKPSADTFSCEDNPQTPLPDTQ